MKRKSEDPTNQNTVPVLDRDGSPLMPTRPSRARRLMRKGRARKRWVKGADTVWLTPETPKYSMTFPIGIYGAYIL